MIYGYIRVSTDKQTVENQRYEITQFCSRDGLYIDGWIEETISGTKNYDKRKLGQLLERTTAGDLIICTELSRRLWPGPAHVSRTARGAASTSPAPQCPSG